MPDEILLTDEQMKVQEAIRFFLTESCQSQLGTLTNSTDLYNAFSNWWLQRHPSDPIPSHRLFGTMFQAHGIKRKKSGGKYYYLNIVLQDDC